MTDSSSLSVISPRDTLLPYINASQNDTMAYPTNIMPGARDVTTPFGTMRANEWGPEDGRRVLFVHGDATPSPMWSIMAHELVQRGCRVLCYDMWGRGYSDTPNSTLLDGRHLSLQILFAIASSNVSWTNRPGFALVGFSLGGAISTEFASHFPNLINSLLLLGPGGLIRDLPADYYSPLFSMPWQDASRGRDLRDLVASIMGVSGNNPDAIRVNRSQEQKNNREEFVPVDEQNWRPPKVDVAGLLQWQFDYNAGHVKAFWETTANGPLCNQESSFRRAFDVITGKSTHQSLLRGTKLLVFLGADDGVVKPDETRDDILKLIPPDNVDFIILPGGHGFPYPNSLAIVERLSAHWSLEKRTKL